MSLRERLFLVMVAVLPLHTVFLSAWISWKPYLVLVGVLAIWDLIEGVRVRAFPWHRRVSLASGRVPGGGRHRLSGPRIS